MSTRHKSFDKSKSKMRPKFSSAKKQRTSFSKSRKDRNQENDAEHDNQNSLFEKTKLLKLNSDQQI